MAERLEPMTMRELLALPVITDLRTAARALGIPENRAYRLARSGGFPCEVKRYGHEWSVPRAGIFRELGLDPAMVLPVPVPADDSPVPARPEADAA